MRFFEGGLAPVSGQYTLVGNSGIVIKRVYITMGETFPKTENGYYYEI